jgi:hypothetical protein
MISLAYNGSYIQNLDKYYELSTDIGTSEDDELYFSLTKHKGSHASIVVWNLDRDNYDLFDTVHTPICHHRIAIKYFLNIEENEQSKPLASDQSSLCSRCSNLQGEHTRKILCSINNLCNLYDLARYVCSSHLAIETYFRSLDKTNPEKLIYLIGGLSR